MNSYIIAYLSLHDGELVQSWEHADSEYEAMLNYLNITSEECPTEDSIQEWVSNCDSWINCILVS